MSFMKRIQQRYEVRASEWKQDIAQVLLADAVGTELESSESEIKQNWKDQYRKVLDLKKEFRGALEDRIEDLTPHNVELAKFLPIALVERISTEVKSKIGVTLEEMWNEDEGWASSTALGALGHGVGPFDDDHDDFLSEHGIDPKVAETAWRKHQLFENDHNAAMEWIDAVISAEKDSSFK